MSLTKSGINIGSALQLIAASKRGNNKALAEKRLAALNVLHGGLGAEGGYFMSSALSDSLLDKIYGASVLAQRATRVTGRDGQTGDELVCPRPGETDRVGTRYGAGFEWTAERGTLPTSAPCVSALRLKCRKIGGVIFATDELASDAERLTQFIETIAGHELAFRLDEAIFRGTGVGQPQGILAAPATITVPGEMAQPAGTVIDENITNMIRRFDLHGWANAIWLVNSQAMTALAALQGFDAATMALYGRPVVPSEQCSTIGAVGDICLADLSQYAILERPLKTAISADLNFVNDEIAFKFCLHVDGAPIWAAPIIAAHSGGVTVSPFVTLAERS